MFRDAFLEKSITPWKTVLRGEFQKFEDLMDTTNIQILML